MAERIFRGFLFLGRRIFSRILSPDFFSSFLWEKVPRKILQENPWQNPPKFTQQKSPTHFYRGAGPTIPCIFASHSVDSRCLRQVCALKLKALPVSEALEPRESFKVILTFYLVSGPIRPRQGTEICNFGAPSPRLSTGFFALSPGFMCNLVRRAPENLEKVAKNPVEKIASNPVASVAVMVFSALIVRQK